LSKVKIFHLVLLGLSLRLLFYFFGGELYFGKEKFYIQGDTFDYINPFVNLINSGTFTVNPNHPEGVFGREPGYSFITGLFFLLAGKNYLLGFKLLVFFQIIVDSLLIWIIFKAVLNIYSEKKIALLAAFIYSIYPFILIWTCVVYAEWAGVACCILFIYFVSKDTGIKNLFFAGVFAGIGTLIRPSVVFLVPATVAGYFLICFLKKNYAVFIKHAIVFLFGFIMIYGWWPLRNLVFHNEIEFFKRVEGITRAISPDQLNFAFFMWSVKTDWDPQISQLLSGKEVEMPDWVWKKLDDSDSLKLKEALMLSFQCGDGFRQLRQLPPLPKNEDCTEEVTIMWKELKQAIIKNAPLQYYFLVPLGNLKKALFKMSLISSFNRSNKDYLINVLVTLLFLFRTVLILSGLAGLYFSIKNYRNHVSLIIIFFYFLLLYFWLCYLYRDMDIRYLLPADILLLIPATFFLYQLKFMFGRFFFR
jgi:hypothetical protein